MATISSALEDERELEKATKDDRARIIQNQNGKGQPVSLLNGPPQPGFAHIGTPGKG